MPEDVKEGVTISDADEKFNGTYEVVPYSRSQAEAEALAAAVTAFEEDRHSASFSKRNPDLGKMINCSLCGMRHRVHDPVMLNSRAHDAQLWPIDMPSRTVAFAKKRLHPHLNCKNLVFVQRVRELLEAYGGFEEVPEDATEEQLKEYTEKREKKLKMIKGIVRARLIRERQQAKVRARSLQKRNRRINRGLLCS